MRSHKTICSPRFIQTADSFRTKQSTIFMKESLNHWKTWFVHYKYIRDAPNVRQPKLPKRPIKLYRKMTWRDQIEVRTNAGNMSAVWKYLKLLEKDAKIITSTDSERRFSAASHISDEKRKGWLLLVTVWWPKPRNDLKQLVNKLQNVL